MADMNWLIDWYKSKCDGDWEHDNGVAISTLDNPGWYMTVSLTGTGLEKAELENVTYQSDSDDDDWYDINLTDEDHDGELIGPHYVAACGPSNLNKVIDHFKKFTEDHSKDKFTGTKGA